MTPNKTKTKKTPSPASIRAPRAYWEIDATDQVLGRLSTRVARLLIGKDKKEFLPHIDNGDYVVITNARKITLTGRKAASKVYYRHTNYPGGIKSEPFSKMIEEHPDEVVKKAVKGMLPSTKLGRRYYKRLKVFADKDHPYKETKELKLS